MNEEYHKIIDRVRQNSSSSEDHEKLISLFGENELEYEIKNAMFCQLEKTEEGQPEGIDFNSIYKRLWDMISEKERKDKIEYGRTLFLKIISVAAIVVVGIIIGRIFPSANQTSEPVFFTSISPKGSVSKMYLPDSTLVYLNAGSEMKYKLGQDDGKREVFLSGEAWFDVKSNPEKAFLVHTSYYDVKVIGTEFNVRAYDEDKEITTTLEEGKVEILSGEQLNLQSPIVISPGEQITYNKEARKINIKEVNSSLYSSWKDNKLIFINKSFKELEVILERKYGVDIHVVDTSIYKYHYDGTIKDESLFEMLDMIKTTLPVTYRIKEQEVIIERK